MLMRTGIMTLLSVAVLGGCAIFEYHPTDGFLHTRAAAFSGNPDAQLDLARMFSNPAAWPQMQGRQPDPVHAAEWCTIYQMQGIPADPTIAASGPSCPQIMASLPPDAANRGAGRGVDYINSRQINRRR